MGKPDSYGIKGNIHKWIIAFLTVRSQVVKVNGTESNSTAALSGIPQGSVLGSILFVLCINDLSETVLSDIYLFADDTKILRQITSRLLRRGAVVKGVEHISTNL